MRPQSCLPNQIYGNTSSTAPRWIKSADRSLRLRIALHKTRMRLTIRWPVPDSPGTSRTNIRNSPLLATPCGSPTPARVSHTSTWATTQTTLHTPNTYSRVWSEALPTVTIIQTPRQTRIGVAPFPTTRDTAPAQSGSWPADVLPNRMITSGVHLRLRYCRYGYLTL